MAEQRRTTCNRDCPDACGIVATVEDGRVTRLSGDPEHPVTGANLCYRTSRFLELQYSPERVTRPLLRKNGTHVPVSWDEALDFVAEKLLKIRAESGPASIFHYRSGGSLGMMLSLTDYFWERFGPVTIKRGDICSGAGDLAQLTDFGEEDSHDLFDLLNSKQILVWGKNVVTSSPHTLPVLKAARERGAELVLIDPVHHKTAHHCDLTYDVRPGGDFALAMAVARVLFERGWTDPEAASYCDHLDAFRQMAQARSPEAWCAEAGVEPAIAEDLARRLGPGKPAAILVGWGMGRRANGGAIVRALDALSAISGNIGIPGGGVSFFFKRKGAFDLSFLQGDRIAPRTVCEPLFGQELLDARDPPIRAVWITAGNPVVMLPESGTIARALESRELVVVADSFYTDTAERAHLVLPTATMLEADDVVGAYGHHWLGVVRPVIEPPPEVKTDLQILQALAPRLGMDGVLDGDARAWKQRFVAPKLGPKGLSIDDLEAGRVRNPLPPKVIFADRKFPTTSGKINLITTPPPPPPEPTEAHPLLLMSLSTEKSQASQWSRALRGPMVATVHPDSSAGIPHGGTGRLESPVGTMVVRVEHDPRQRRDVVLVPKGGDLRSGRCANVLIRAAITDLGEGGALYDERVRLVPA